MVSFQTENPNLGKFWRALNWKVLIYIMAIWNILHTFGIFNDTLVHFMFIWYIFSGLGIMYQEKSGNPAKESQRSLEHTFWLCTRMGQNLDHYVCRLLRKFWDSILARILYFKKIN
jgi:hypothetical protein